MKILELDLRAFGPFTDVRLDLAEGHDGMHILYGPNEAGKSSALRALKCLLYGIPKNSADNFIHENKTLRIGGRLRNADGAEFAFLRRKGNKDTLLNTEGVPVDERTLDRFLHGVTEETFGLLFGIDHEALVRGGRNILAGKGETGQSLFAAGSGGANLRAVLEAIENDADALFKNKGQIPVINKAVSRHQELRKRISDLSQSSREWAEKEKELRKAMAERDNLRQTLERNAAEVNRLKRLIEIIPRAGLLRETRAKVEAMGEVIILPEEFAARRHQAEKQLNAAIEVKRRAELDLERLHADIAKIMLPQKLLDQADAIEAIRERLGQYRKAAADLGTLTGRLQQNKADIRVLLLELAPGRDVEAVKGMRPRAAGKTRIQKLASRHEALQAEQARAAKALREAEKKLGRLKDELKALEAPKDSAPLKKSLAKLAKSGDLAAALQEAQKALQNEERQARGLLQLLPLWSRSFEEVGRVPVPSSETVSRFEDDFSGWKTLIGNLNSRLGDAWTELQRVEQKIDAIRLAGAVPTEEDLEKIRDRRQTGWGLVKRAWLEGENIEEESRAYDPERDLAAAYEASVEQADDTADRLRREAARVAEYAALVVQAGKAKEEIARLERERNDAQQATARTTEEWKAAWKPAGIDPMTPREMRAWLEQYGKILQRLEKMGEQRALIEKIQGKIGEHREELSRHLEALGEKRATEEEPFGQLADRCEVVQERLEQVARMHAELESKLSAIADEIKAHTQAQADAEKRLADWRNEWTEAVKTLGMGEGTTPDEALVTLSKLDELFKKIDESDDLERRIFGINRDAERFTADVKALIGHVAPDWERLPADQAAAQLSAELTRARDAATRHAHTAREIEQKSRGLREAEKEIALATGKLNGLCRQAGCQTPDELESRERRSAEYQELKQRIQALETDIVERGGGAPLQQILQEVEKVDVDALTAQIEELEKELSTLKERQSELDERVGGLRSELGRIDGSSAAAVAAEEAQGVLASIRDHVDDYVKLRLASLVLRQAIENYRAKNQGPLLERAGALFARLTLGSFSGLKTDYSENDEPVLQGVRPDGRVVDVSGMSDGTLDQLYLSLRLATLEKYLETNEPMPFIVDDILIRFDDDRARATLEVLADLSKKTQVLFFTHHARLAEMAKEVKADDGIYLHTMR
ncbi:MAG TPA: AAA family ATPase [Syntrophales bacterium]|nr:AAA family ATPase [Syntrophales bacterium]